MVGEWLAWLPGPALALARQFLEVLRYPLDAGQRIYWLYLLSSLAFAFGVWAVRRRSGATRDGFWRFCFPREVWSHPSAWLDVRYFLVHQVVRLWIYGALVVSLSIAAMGAVWSAIQSVSPQAVLRLDEPTLLDRALITGLSILLADFLSFLAHWLQHRVPWLWEFHRVHHSLPVMHPLSNYREHPVDNLFYALTSGLALGSTGAIAAFGLGCELGEIGVLGINVFFFLFNFAGYNLRHSHIWLAWPRWLAPCFGSPAYHQIHHSTAPEHHDRNLAFLFPFWDRLFGTQHLPGREPEPLRFGLGDGSEPEYHSIWRLYTLPFARLARGEARPLGRIP